MFLVRTDAKDLSLLDEQWVLTRQSQYRTSLTQTIFPFSNQCPTISPQLSVLLYDTAATLVHMYDHHIYRALYLMLTLNLSIHWQHRRLGINQVYKN